jgi:hypothetical protein
LATAFRGSVLHMAAASSTPAPRAPRARKPWPSLAHRCDISAAIAQITCLGPLLTAPWLPMLAGHRLQALCCCHAAQAAHQTSPCPGLPLQLHACRRSCSGPNFRKCHLLTEVHEGGHISGGPVSKRRTAADARCPPAGVDVRGELVAGAGAGHAVRAQERRGDAVGVHPLPGGAAQRQAGGVRGGDEEPVLPLHGAPPHVALHDTALQDAHRRAGAPAGRQNRHREPLRSPLLSRVLLLLLSRVLLLLLLLPRVLLLLLLLSRVLLLLLLPLAVALPPSCSTPSSCTRTP